MSGLKMSIIDDDGCCCSQRYLCRVVTFMNIRMSYMRFRVGGYDEV